MAWTVKEREQQVDKYVTLVERTSQNDGYSNGRSIDQQGQVFVCDWRVIH